MGLSGSVMFAVGRPGVAVGDAATFAGLSFVTFDLTAIGLE